MLDFDGIESIFFNASLQSTWTAGKIDTFELLSYDLFSSRSLFLKSVWCGYIFWLVFVILSQIFELLS